jgi:hypothetical protein
MDPRLHNISTDPRVHRIPRYGGSFSIISIAIIPRDQTSTFAPYSFCLTTSGAIQYGVPTIVARLDFCSVSFAQKPKSVILTVPEDDSRTLSDLMSRWIMFFV